MVAQARGGRRDRPGDEQGGDCGERCGVVMENASKMKQRDKRGGRKGVKREM